MKIPVAEPKVDPEIAPMPNLVGDGWGAPGRAMQQLGSAISSLSGAFDGIDAQANKEQDFQDNMTMLKFSNKVDLDEIKARSEYTGKGDDYATARLESYASSRDTMLSGISPRNQQKAQIFAMRKEGTVGESAARFGGEIKQGETYADVGNQIGEQYSLLQHIPPEQFNEKFEQITKGVDAIIDSTPLPPHYKEALRERAAHEAESVLLNPPSTDDPSADPNAVRSNPVERYQRFQRYLQQHGGPITGERDRGPGTPGFQGGPGEGGDQPQSTVPGISVGPQSSIRPQHPFPIAGMTPDQVPRSGGSPNSREWMGPRANGGHHAGWDIPANPGTPVQAVSNGTVVRVGQGQGYGAMIDVKYADGTVHRIAHLGNVDKGGDIKPFAPALQVGDKVKAGEVLGFSGYSGNAGREFPHVHYEVFPNTARYQAAAGGSSRATANLRSSPRDYFSAGVTTVPKTTVAEAQPQTGVVQLGLKGIAKTGPGWKASDAKGAFDERSADAIAQARGHTPVTINAPGSTDDQVKATVQWIRDNPDKKVSLLGYSGGGYSAKKVYAALTPEERSRVVGIDVVGAPGQGAAKNYPGAPQGLVKEYNDTKVGHAEQLKSLATNVAQNGARGVQVASNDQASGVNQWAAQGIKGRVTAYTPQKSGDKMEGGYASSRPGPDGKAEVRTIADYAAGRSQYITVAGNPKFYGKSYIIPELDYNGKTLTNVRAVVHDTGSAFKNAPEGRFDIPVDRDLSDKQTVAATKNWNNVRFIPEEQFRRQNGGVAQNAATPANRMPGQGYADRIRGRLSDASQPRNPNTIPVASDQVADAAGLAADAHARQARAIRQLQPPDKWTPDYDTEHPSGRVFTPGDTDQGISQDPKFRFREQETPFWARGKVADASGQITPSQYGGQPTTINNGTEQPSVTTHLRDLLVRKMPAYREEFYRQVGQMIGDVEKAAASGYTVPDDQMQMTSQAVSQLGDPDLKARLDSAQQTAKWVATLRQETPEHVSQVAAQMRSDMLKNGATPELMAQAKATEELSKSIDENLKKNPIAWGVNVGVLNDGQVPITAETLGPDTLKQRALAVETLKEHYGRDVPFFSSDPTNDEREAVKAVLAKGGDDTIRTLGMMYDTLGDQHMLSAMKEISKDAPDLAMTGWLLSQKGDPQTIKDMASGLKLKAADDFKPLAPAENLARSTAVADYGTALMAMPQAEGRVIAAANLLYEVRARRMGVPGSEKNAFNATLWTQCLHDAMGENTDPHTGIKYGGIAAQGSILPGFLGGGYQSNYGQKIIVPTNVRNDKIPDLVGAIKMTDLVKGGMPSPDVGLAPPKMSEADKAAVGDASVMARASGDNVAATIPIQTRGAPINANGQIATIAQLRSANLVSIGDGKYWLAAGNPSGPDPKWIGSNDTADGRYVLDLKALEPVLKARVPDAYRPE